MCESGYILKVIIHHTDILNESYFRNLYCFNQNKYLDVLFINHSKSIGHSLTQQHRLYIHRNIKEVCQYDHIGYFENDMDFKLSNLKYYLYTLALIEKHKIKGVIPGFKRYELSTCDNGDVWKSCPDYETQIEYKLINNEIFIGSKNSHFSYGGMWILPKNKLIKYINEKEFLEIPKKKNYYTYNGDREYYASIYWEKHYQSLIPLSKFDESFLHHISNKYIHHKKSIQIADLYKQMNLCKSQYGLIYKGNMFNKKFSINYNIINRNKCVSLRICNS